MNINRPSTIFRTYPGTICRSYGAGRAGREIYFLTGFTGFDRIILFFIFIIFRTKVMKNNPPLAEVIQTFVCMSYASPKMDVFSSCPIVWQRDRLMRIEVKEGEFSSVTDQIKMAGGKVLRLEPRKRSLEDIFLDVTQRSNSKSLQA